MGAIRSLCTKGIFLDNGQVVEAGDLGSCITRYFRSIGALENNDPNAADSEREGFKRVYLPEVDGNTVNQGDDVVISTSLQIDGEPGGFSLYCIVEDMHGRQLIHLREESTELGVSEIRPGVYDIRVALPPLWLNPGLYALAFQGAYVG